MGRIDLEGDRVVRLLVASVDLNRKLVREHEKGGDWGGASIAYAAHASVLTVLQVAIIERTRGGSEAAREMVENGECEMAWNTPTPAWWGIMKPCCGIQYGYHILYGEGDLAILVCPFKRGYWQLARVLLKDAPQLIRKVAQATARNVAPRWTHWASPPTASRNFGTSCLKSAIEDEYNA